MSHLILTYTVCSLVVELSLWYSLDKTLMQFCSSLKFCHLLFARVKTVYSCLLTVQGILLRKQCKTSEMGTTTIVLMVSWGNTKRSIFTDDTDDTRKFGGKRTRHCTRENY